MKAFRNYSLLALIILALTGCSSVIDVVKVSNTVEPSKEQGYFYSLPRNIVKIDVVVNETEMIKGPYAEFAEKYLGLSNVIETNSTNYEISEFRISTYAEPDPMQFYQVVLTDKLFGDDDDDDFKMQLTESGLIMNTTSRADSLITEKKVFSSAIEENVYPDIFKSYTDLNMFEKVDTIIERVNLAKDTIEKITFRRSMVTKTPEQKAKSAADFIIKVKENRFNLISGFQEVNYDKETFKQMNNELENLENEYRKLFTGISFTKKRTYSFLYLPDANKPSDSMALFKFSKQKGVLDTANESGETVHITIHKAGITDTLKAFTERPVKGKISNHGLYYRIADYGDVKVYYDGEENLSARFLIPQYGVVTSLPADMERYRYFPNTGAINTIGKK